MTNEQLVKQLIRLLNEKNAIPSDSIKNTIPVGISNRHIHLSQQDLESLFGEGYKLTPIKELKQPGQYAAKETVLIAGPKGTFEKVRVLGPVRPVSQIEISKSDSFTLGIKPPVRESGDLTNAATLTVIGPFGSVIMEKKVIIAKRHIHMTPIEAEQLNVIDRQLVSIRVEGERGGTLDEVVIRVSDQFLLECHLDMDEANALGISNNQMITIMPKK
ncbi:phosphate propanoyltransferase [Candidatus Enterococcus ikei]|uniref:Phosphate propanoyltransferase n=1 Tax=Candidatus Enterococcus ikei TaxID=2815326 RepID=A0ABS3GVU1_9ENTE|nr:phosphate propanoyltransferase [Enterococcus sp. DIV0869a]MBO0439383.1 phosphate propanoyltransferase [Enterococcus sp. DIV0869a]